MLHWLLKSIFQTFLSPHSYSVTFLISSTISFFINKYHILYPRVYKLSLSLSSISPYYHHFFIIIIAIAIILLITQRCFILFLSISSLLLPHHHHHYNYHWIILKTLSSSSSNPYYHNHLIMNKEIIGDGNLAECQLKYNRVFIAKNVLK